MASKLALSKNTYGKLTLLSIQKQPKNMSELYEIISIIDIDRACN